MFLVPAVVVFTRRLALAASLLVVLQPVPAAGDGPGVGDANGAGGEVVPATGSQFIATDSLACDVDPDPDAQACLAGLRWEPAQFAVDVEPAEENRGDRLIYYPSPRPVGNAVHDRVAMEWYAAKDEQGSPIIAPAVVVVHESGRSMPVGRMIARELRGQGLHAFLIHLPGYGQRRTALADQPEMILRSLQQGIADVRRARDAIASLPAMVGARVGVQGTSLGGFVISTVVGLDSGYDRAFILLAGGNLHDVVLRGKKDAAKIRERLHGIGIQDEQIADLARPVEPLRLAHRIAAQQTWLYNGSFDDVVPRASSYALARAAGLPADHHIELPANHYTGIIFLPVVIQQIHQAMTQP